MRRWFSCGGLLAVLAVAGCSEDVDPFDPTRDSVVRFINATFDVGAVDVRIEGATAVQGLPPVTGSGYSFTAAGARNIQFVDPATGSTLAGLTPALAAGSHYTLLLTGLPDAIQTLVIEDEADPAPSGQMMLRFVHVAPNTNAVDVYVTAPNADLNTATPQLTDLTFREVSAYLTLAAGQGQIRVTAAGDPSNVLIDSEPRDFVSGQVSTLFVMDTPDGKGPFGLFLADGT